MESDKETGHQKRITSLSKSIDGSHFLTSSLDKSAKVGVKYHCILSLYCRMWLIHFMCLLHFFQLWDTRTLTLLKTYVTSAPVNACAISPLLDHVRSQLTIYLLNAKWEDYKKLLLYCGLVSAFVCHVLILKVVASLSSFMPWKVFLHDAHCFITIQWNNEYLVGWRC